MLIQTLFPPVAGKTFRFNVAGCHGTTNIEVFINDQQILDNEQSGLICKSAAEVPPDSGGKTLSVRASDSAGHNQTLEYEISASDPGPHSMLTKSRMGALQ